MMQSHPNGIEPAAVDLAQLLDQVCGSALRLLAGTPCPPRNLSMRAGQVSIELELAGEPASAGAAPAVSAPAPAAESAPEKTVPADGCLTAQTVGVFYRAPEPGADPFVREGDEVRVGQQIGIIEAMKLMIPVEADRAGRIVEVLKADGEPVEYGEALFALEAA